MSDQLTVEPQQRPNPGRLLPLRSDEHQSRVAKSRGPSYRPGMFDRLMEPKAPLPPKPEEIQAVQISVAASGRELVVEETLKDGSRHARRLLREYPYYCDITLPNGDQITIEVQRFECAALPADALEQPPEPEPEPGQAPAQPDRPDQPAPKLRPTNLFSSSW